MTMTMTGLFARVRQTRLASVRRLALIMAGVAIGTFQLCGLVGLRINASPSLPVGLYMTSSQPNTWSSSVLPNRSPAWLSRAATVMPAHAETARRRS